MPLLQNGPALCHYRVHGYDDRPALFLSHSLGQDHGMWDLQAEWFTPHFRVIRYDTRGHGASGAPAGDYSVQDLGEDAIRLADALGIDRFAFCGLSLGGMIAQQLALDYPAATASLVLADTVCGVPPGAEAIAGEALRFIETHSMAEVAKTRITTAFTDAVDPVMRLHMIEAVALNDKDAYERSARAAFKFSARQRLQDIAVPTLVVVGEGDRTFPLEWMEELATRIRGARLVRLAGAGHISSMERPREFNDALLGFLGV